MKKLLVFVGAALAFGALYVSTNLNSKKKEEKEDITIEDLDSNDQD